MKNKHNDYEQSKNGTSKFILDVCDEISNLTEEQYQNERKFFTSFDEELDSFSKNLSKKIENGKIENDINK